MTNPFPWQPVMHRWCGECFQGVEEARRFSVVLPLFEFRPCGHTAAFYEEGQNRSMSIPTPGEVSFTTDDAYDGPPPPLDAVKEHYASKPSLRDNLAAKGKLQEAHERGNCDTNRCCAVHDQHTTPHKGCILR